MKVFLFILLTNLIFNYMVLFDFKSDSDISNWRVVDDVVMGGQSNGNFFINNEGHGVFQGKVSLDNNGGFSSVQYRLNAIHVKEKKRIIIRIKGDGKRYQIRIKSNRFDNHSYIYYFETSGDWQNIEIPLTEMYPSFRGMRLKMENFPGEKMEELSFLIANKKAESFKLLIDIIELH